MNLIILFEGRYVRFIQGTYKGGRIQIVKQSAIDLYEHELYNQDLYDTNKLMPLIKVHMKEQKYGKKNIRVVLNNRQVIYRELSIPVANRNDSLNMVRNEMIASLNLNDDYLVNYVLIDKKKDEKGEEYQRVLGTALLTSVLTRYLDLFKNVGVKIDSINVANDAVIKILKDVNNTKMTLYFDINKNYMRLFLFDRGEYVLTRNIRYYEDENYEIEDLKRMIIDNINKMEQFQSSRDREMTIEKVELFGNSKYIRYLADEEYGDYEVSVLSSKPLYKDIANYEAYVNALGALMGVDNNYNFINLLKKYEKQHKSAGKKGNGGKTLRNSTILGVLIVVAVVGYQFGMKFVTEGKIKKTNNYINSPSVQERYLAAEHLVQSFERMQELQNITEDVKAQLHAMARFDQKAYDAIFTSDITVTSLTFNQESMFTLTADAKESTGPAAYVAHLKSKDFISEINYNGYSGDTGRYSFTITFKYDGGQSDEN